MYFTRKYPNFLFCHLPLFLVPLAYNILAEQLLESVQLVASCLCRGATQSENVHLIHNTAFANCAN